jgi:copper chaperone CopZ
MNSAKIIVFLFSLMVLTATVFGQCQKSCGHEAECGAKGHDVKMHEMSGKSVQVELPTVICAMCKETIEKGMAKVDGILGVSVDVEKKSALINYDPAKLDVAKIESAISMLGYQANKVAADKAAHEKLADCCKDYKKS